MVIHIHGNYEQDSVKSSHKLISKEDRAMQTQNRGDGHKIMQSIKSIIRGIRGRMLEPIRSTGGIRAAVTQTQN